jgi:riboflavin transporter FmnP
MVTLIFLALMPVIGAAFGVSSLRNGLTLIVSGSATANIGFLIGALYATLYVFTTLIYLDRRENTFCMAMNCCSSLLAGIAASYALSQLVGMATPAWFELTGVGMIIVALMFLSPLHHIPEWAFAYLVQRLPPRLRGSA